MACHACKRDLEASSFPEGGAVCFACCMALGVIPLPPPRRPALPCTRCNGMKFVRVMPRELAVRRDDELEAAAAPMALTHAFARVSGGPATCPTLYDQRGLVETYVCKACGFVEWYCQRPDQIPIGPAYMSDEIDYEGTEPYR